MDQTAIVTGLLNLLARQGNFQPQPFQVNQQTGCTPEPRQPPQLSGQGMPHYQWPPQAAATTFSLDWQASELYAANRPTNNRISNFRCNDFDFLKQLSVENREKILKYRNKYRKSLRKRADHLVDTQKYITNLSSKPLTQMESGILVPTKRMHRPKLSQAFADFQRSNRLYYRFRNQTPPKPHPFRRKSTWNPPRASKEIEEYLDRVEESLRNLTPKHFHHNLTREETRTLNRLASNQDLVIKSADKGSGIVVEDTDKYVTDGLAYLSDQKIYREIDQDPTPQLAKAINRYMTSMHKRGTIDQTTKDYLTFKEDETPRTQQLYFLKKIHKDPISVRPIVSGCGGPTEKISQLVDLHLQPFVSTIDSHIDNTGHLINILKKTKLPTNCTLATIDVSALYLNIPHNEGIQAVRNRTMTDLLNIILTRNHFQFAGKMYHQVQGTAMGTKMAPAYANIFMAELEEGLLRTTTPPPSSGRDTLTTSCVSGRALQIH